MLRDYFERQLKVMENVSPKVGNNIVDAPEANEAYSL